eukprot:1714941-Heterocapsa_arctica.AAC.1
MEDSRAWAPQLSQVFPLGNAEEPLHGFQGMECVPDGRRVLGSHHEHHEPQIGFYSYVIKMIDKDKVMIKATPKG